MCGASTGPGRLEKGILLDTILAQQILAALITAPAALAHDAAGRIETDDFEDWKYRTIFDAWQQCELADYPTPGSVLVQINARLLAAGHYRDTDNGLRALVAELAGITGHPEQLPAFVNELVEHRFRRAAVDYARAVAAHAHGSPLEDIRDALNGITELRRLYGRITATRPRLVSVTKNGGAA